MAIVSGVAVGLVCSLAAGTMMRTLLFGVRRGIVADAGSCCGGAGSVALMASYVPARRAASVIRWRRCVRSRYWLTNPNRDTSIIYLPLGAGTMTALGSTLGMRSGR